MIGSNDNSLPIEENDSDRRRGIIADDALTMTLVSAFAGDRPLTNAEENRVDDLKKNRGRRFFSDLLYSVTHQYFAPEVAEDLWTEILTHKYELSKALGRNAGITVATLDYFTNITDNMLSATLIGETQIGEIVGLSLRDGLTGLFNHTYFYQQIDLEIRRYLRYGTLVSLVLIDIDDFKLVNDIFGHPEGDKILAAMGQTLLRLARDSDICCRYGGEELAVILPLTDANEVVTIANRIRKEIKEHLPDGRTLTVSIGVATCGPRTRTFRDLVKEADAALYQAKKNGKNRVEVFAGN